MKNFITKFIALILIIMFSSFYIGCGDSDSSSSIPQTTGVFNFKLQTGTKIVNEGTAEEEEQTYKYYTLTGYQVSSKDALAIKDGDFSGIDKKYYELEIPKTGRDLGKDNDYPVEEIASSCFAGQQILKKVFVGKNIRKIGQGAFGGCTNLSYIELPFIGESIDGTNEKRMFAYIFGSAYTDTANGNTEITARVHSLKINGEEVSQSEDVKYYLPTSLKEVKINGVVQDKDGGEDILLTNIPQNAFYGTTTLTKIEYPSTVNEINTHAFYGCTSLTSIDISNVETIYDYAFYGCSALDKIEFGQQPKVKTIYDYAFATCTSLGKSVLSVDKPLIFPQSLTVLGKGAFSGCEKLRIIDTSNSGITVLNENVFSDCTSLKKLIVNSTTTANIYALKGCSSLKDSTADKYNVVDVDGNYIDYSPEVYGNN